MSDRYIVATIECDADHAFTPNEREYKLLDSLNNTLSLGSWKQKEVAEGLAAKKNIQWNLLQAGLADCKAGRLGKGPEISPETA